MNALVIIFVFALLVGAYLLGWEDRAMDDAFKKLDSLIGKLLARRGTE